MARIIPVLLMQNGRLVKTTRFHSPKYIGCAKNTIKVFTELKSEELIILGIDRKMQNRYFDRNYLSSLAYDAQMPLAYGGGIRTLDDAKLIFDCGFE